MWGAEYYGDDLPVSGIVFVMPGSKTTDVRLRIAVTNAPMDMGTSFGLQDKSGAIRPGTLRSMHSVVFECDAKASDRGDGSEPNFLGRYAHGTTTARFLNISHGARGGTGWIKRIKVPLSSITWSMIDAAPAGALETDVDGRSSGTVPVTWRPQPA